MMEFRGTLELRHFSELCRSVKAPDYPPHRRHLGLVFIAVFALILGVFFVFPRLGLASVDATRSAVLSFGAGAILGAIWALAFLRNEHKAMLRQDGGALGPRRFQTDDAGLLVEGAASSLRTRWSGITHMTDAEHTLLLWTDPGAAIMVPKDAFDSEAARAAFVAFVEARIGAAQAAS